MLSTKSIIFFSLILISPQVLAGKIGDFETDIQNNKPASRSTNSQYCNHCNSHSNSFFDALFDSLLEDMAEFAVVVVEDGRETSDERIKKNPTKPGIKPRKNGEIIIPFYRLNINYQYINNDLEAFDFKMEMGKGSNGLELRTTNYNDSDANEELKYSQLQYFHRMSFGNQIGINFGIGYGKMEIIDTYDGLVISLPVLYQNNNHLGIEVRPSYFNANGTDITELDYSIMYTHRKMAFRLGHRNIRSTNIDIKGIYLGMDFIF